MPGVASSPPFLPSEDDLDRYSVGDQGPVENEVLTVVGDVELAIRRLLDESLEQGHRLRGRES